MSRVAEKNGLTVGEVSAKLKEVCRTAWPVLCMAGGLWLLILAAWAAL
jgi:hypothetical protein